MKILLVEDDRGVRETLAGILTAVGHDVSVATDGARALGMLRTGELPSVILVDLMMPNMDGYRFREAQKGDVALAHIPVIAITADRRADAQLLGAEIIRKPFDPDVLLRALAKYETQASGTRKQ